MKTPPTTLDPNGDEVPSSREWAVSGGFIYRRDDKGVMRLWCSAAGLDAPQALVQALNRPNRANDQTQRDRYHAAKQQEMKQCRS